MDSAAPRRPGAFSALPTTPTTPIAPQYHQRSPSSESDSSVSSQVVAMSSNRPTYQQQQSQQRPPLLTTTSSSTNSSTSSLHNFSRPSIAQIVSDVPSRKNSPLNPGTDPRSHKRNNSQGFFEPSLPTATTPQLDQQQPASAMALSASQIAAQAAMQAQSAVQHARKRSQTVPSPQNMSEPNSGRQKPPPIPTQSATGRRPSTQAMPPPQYPQSSMNSPTMAATSAANAAYPRGMQLSPGLTTFTDQPASEGKAKSERSKMKLFSKPKHIGIPGYKESSAKERLQPSPGKVASPGPSLLSNKMNASTTSLSDPVATGSIYTMQNSSTSTLVPSERQRAEDKEKAHKHHFLSRQKNKLKDRMDDHSTLTLSSASSNSKPMNPNAPESIYSFAPSSPGLAQGTFAKSVSGLDLRHGGRALREKKKEEKNADSKRADADRHEWLTASYGPPSGTAASIFAPSSAPEVAHLGPLTGFGLSNMTPEEAWDFLKAKLLIIFEGEELRMPVEDLNRLVSVHIQRCVQKRAPSIITEDLEDLLQTGFLSLDQTLRGVQDSQLVPYLVEMWLFVFGTVLPYMQAVFLPLDLEFHGHGPIMKSGEASEFWGLPLPDPSSPSYSEDSTLDVRRAVLLAYRDNVILPRFDALKAVFSRLSLESINVVGLNNLDSPSLLPSPLISPPGFGSNNRPGTAGSLDPSYGSSFNSQSSTLLGEGARSRAASNTSAPGAELPPFSPSAGRRALPGSVLQAGLQERVGGRGGEMDSAKVTETVGRMLQCMSVLASLRSADEAQMSTEELTRALKLNWLGRGRTGRNRKGFIGARVVRRAAGPVGVR